MTQGTDLITAVQEGLASPEPRARMAALLSALAIPDPAQAKPLLHRAANEDADPQVRHTAQRTIALLEEKGVTAGPGEGQAAGDKVVEKFRELLADARPKIRLGALTKVLKYRSTKLLPLVEEALDREQVPQVQAAIVDVLGRLGAVECLARLVRLLDHSEASVAARAVSAVAALGRDAALPLLALLLERRESQILSAVLTALMPTDPARVFATLDQLAGSDDESARSAAFHCLAQLEDPRCVPIAEKLLAKETNEELAEAAREFLSRLKKAGEEGFVEQLRERLTSLDPLVRKSALADAREHLDHPEVRGLVDMLAQLDPDREVQDAAKLVAQENLAELAESESVSALIPELAQMTAEQRAARQEKLVSKFKNLLSRKQERLRMKAVLKAKKYQEKCLLPLIVEKMEFETSPGVLAAMLLTLADIGSDSDVPLISPYLNHRN
ncbi:MAG: HEAT repeat domain-containing protein, partial [Candidatus Riflebacteria bacterium]|nr:HEAT repeat domain-containing protein [Candidatus Riflebacteria bacterium]